MTASSDNKLAGSSGNSGADGGGGGLDCEDFGYEFRIEPGTIRTTSTVTATGGPARSGSWTHLSGPVMGSRSEGSRRGTKPRRRSTPHTANTTGREPYRSTRACPRTSKGVHRRSVRVRAEPQMDERQTRASNLCHNPVANSISAIGPFHLLTRGFSETTPRVSSPGTRVPVWLR